MGFRLALCVALLIAAAGTAGCGGSPSVVGTSTTEGPLMEAYQRAHPDFVDGPLLPVNVAPHEILSRIREGLDPGREIWLPDYLPEGFALAAPYNGTGIGSAYPNPYAWGRGYGVTYTDGAGYIMVLAGSEDDLSQGESVPLTETAGGRHLRLWRGAEIVAVATVDDGATPLLVSGGGLDEQSLIAELIKVAESLAIH